jgi:hypothetical protein
MSNNVSVDIEHEFESNTDVYAWNEENMLDHLGKTTEPAH